MSETPPIKGQNHTRLGGRIGARIARLVSQAHADHLRKSEGQRAKIGAQAANHFFRGVGGEYRLHLGPIFRQVEEALPGDHPAKSLFGFLARQPGEGAAIVAGNAASSAVGSAIGRIINSAIGPYVDEIVAAAPGEIADPNTYAAAWARGLISEGEASTRAAMAGMVPEVWPILRELAQARPDISSLQQLVNRGVIETETAQEQLRLQGVPGEWAGVLLGLREQVLQPADIADMAVRNIITMEEAKELAGKTGLAGEDIERLILDTGNSLGNQELLFAYRRGIIDKDTLEKGIRQGRTRDEWIPTLLGLSHGPMSTADAVRAVVQNQMSEETGEALALENGLDKQWWPYLVKAYGRPAALMQALSLRNRGIMSTGDVEQAIRESNIKDKYIPFLLHLGRKLPTVTMLKSIVAEGNLTVKDAVRLMIEEGYDQEVAVAYVASAQKVKVHGEHSLAKTDILKLYEEHQLGEAEAKEYLEALGYKGEEADVLTAGADAARALKDTESALNHLRTLYVDHRLSEQQVSADLDALGIAAARRDRLLSVWLVQREANRPRLTAPAIERAYRAKLLSDSEAAERLENLGYTADDARLLLALPAR